MTDADAQLISNRLENLENLIERVEALIRQEISDLKKEQIADLRKENERLADDQRRLWEAVRSLEADRNRLHGGGRVVTSMMTALIAIVTSGIAAVVVEKFLK